jgi:hypothetical protein
VSETRIAEDGELVIYEMPPYIADELATIMTSSAIRKPDGTLREVKDYDQGWILDAESLREAAADVRKVE